MNKDNQQLYKESLIEIVKDISEEKKIERSERFPYYAEARLHGSFNGKETTYWLLNSSRTISMYNYGKLNRFGHFVSKNTYVAVNMLNKNVGEPIEYDTINEIKRKQHNVIVVCSKAEMVQKRISLIDEKQVYTYYSIDSFLNELIKNQQKIEEAEQQIREKEEQKKREADAHQRGIITKQINKIQEERRILTLQQEELGNLTKYIREQGKLRYNPILDPLQNRIKTEHLFDGVPIVIEGGPGTGKTTTMIQRLKYLTDDFAIKEDNEERLFRYKLTFDQRKRLFDLMDQGRDWMFFSPSELLKEYLADAMNKEGLTDTKSKVWNWNEYLKKITRENYLFIDPTNENTPFLACRSNEPLMYQNSDVISLWRSYYLDSLKDKKNKFPKIEESNALYRWKSIALKIKQRFDEVEGYDIVQFVRLFMSLETVYAADCRALLKENRELVSKISEELYALLSEDKIVYGKLLEMLQDGTTERIEVVEDVELLDENEDSEEQNEDDTPQRMMSVIRTWFRRYCYRTKNKNVKLTARQIQLNELLQQFLMKDHLEKVSRVGELVLFEQYAKYTRGIVSNMFSGLLTKYKRFRRMLASQNKEGINNELLKSLLSRRGGKELHPQEQALLVGFINNLVKKATAISNTRLSHTYVDAFVELSRPIIGVDEATDFSAYDIYAIESLLTKEFNSITLCGDMMQRLTPMGITTWQQIEDILPGLKIVKMNTSYRQSYRLLDVAKELYKDSIGVEPDYKAYMKSKKVPVPLAFNSKDENEKVLWIEQRIKEIYSIYKKLPSIAIFLNEARDIQDFVDALKETDFIYDTDIDVVNGSSGRVLASSNQIRVYPINVVKGMEFDVVFFHNIDSSLEKMDIIKRYVYVGVSRAAFFLGATMCHDNKEISRYFEQGRDWKKM